jgi:heme/copper-type cytochrome/quinol oxidase subunit 2
MDAELTFKALTYGVIGLVLLAAFALSLVSMRKEADHDEPLRGLFSLTLIIITVCAIIAICSSYQSATSVQKRAPRQQSQIVELQ